MKYLSRASNNSGYILAGSLAIVLVLSILLGTAMMRTEVQLREVEQKQALQDAFFAAENFSCFFKT